MKMVRVVGGVIKAQSKKTCSVSYPIGDVHLSSESAYREQLSLTRKTFMT